MKLLKLYTLGAVFIAVTAIGLILLFYGVSFYVEYINAASKRANGELMVGVSLVSLYSVPTWFVAACLSLALKHHQPKFLKYCTYAMAALSLIVLVYLFIVE